MPYLILLEDLFTFSIVYLTEEAAEQSAKKNLELKLLQDDLVRRIEIFEKRGNLLVFQCHKHYII